MHSAATPWWAWFLGVVFGAPWIAGAFWMWRLGRHQAAEPPPSLGEMVLRRFVGR